MKTMVSAGLAITLGLGVAGCGKGSGEAAVVNNVVSLNSGETALADNFSAVDPAPDGNKIGVDEGGDPAPVNATNFSENTSS